MSTYEVRDDGTGARRDWMNIFLVNLPYHIVEWDEYWGKWAYVQSNFTLAGARRAVRRLQPATLDTVHREVDGQHVVLDLRLQRGECPS